MHPTFTPAIRFLTAAAAASLALCACANPPTQGSSPAASSAPIHTVQGAGEQSPLVGQNVTVEGVVTGFFRSGAARDGFYLQSMDADADNDPATSEGIYVHAANNAIVGTLKPGERLTVSGRVKEFNGLTEIDSVTDIVRNGTAPLPAATEVRLPLASAGDWERLEGMRVAFPQILTVSGNYTLGQFGELVLSSEGRLVQPTQLIDPNDADPKGTHFDGASNAAAVAAAQKTNKLRTVILDDGDIRSYPKPTPYLSDAGSGKTRRVGDTVEGLTGVLSYRFNAYRVDPQAPVTFVNKNPRPASPPKVGAATLRVGSANVLNYFISFVPPARGANSSEELARQRAKIVASLLAMAPDVCGLMEVERREDNGALADLVAALNASAGAGTYAWVDSSAIAGTDAIQVALIYKPAIVTPVGSATTDTSANAGVFNRPPLAQTFALRSGGAKFTVVVNHFKSKGGNTNTPADRDRGDGQAGFNATRVRQAEALAKFLEAPAERFGDPDVLIVGDLNAYTEEDPIDYLRAAGYEDVVQHFHGSREYSFQFASQSGCLDHALANRSMLAQLTGAAEWHINADEPAFLDYNLENKSEEQAGLNAGTPYRSSDHDPLVVGVALR